MSDDDDESREEQEQGFSSEEDEGEEEELEYSVQFAGRLRSSENELNEDGEIPEHSTSSEPQALSEVQSVVKEKEPVVFLIGWADCMDKLVFDHFVQFSQYSIMPHLEVSVPGRITNFLSTNSFFIKHHPARLIILTLSL